MNILDKLEAKTGIENFVYDYLVNLDMTDEDLLLRMQDICQNGCASGLVSDLIYYDDTIAFYNNHINEINALLAETDTDCRDFREFDSHDPLCLDTNNKNLLAWWAFETVLADFLGIMENLEVLE